MRTTNVHKVGADASITAPADVHRRIELEVAAEIAHAFLTATHPLEVYRLALARVSPLVGARFSSVYLRDPADALLLKLQCAYNWPQDSARYLGQLRIREAGGPTGSSAADDAVVEVPDVFADPTLEEWWEPARELGFSAVISLPLHADRYMRGGAADPSQAPTVGALTFYFAAPHSITDSERGLLALIADQLSAMVAKAQLTEQLRLTNEQLCAANDELQRRLKELDAASQIKNESGPCATPASA
jgi:GAF domain-containing protein